MTAKAKSITAYNGGIEYKVEYSPLRSDYIEHQMASSLDELFTQLRKKWHGVPEETIATIESDLTDQFKALAAKISAANPNRGEEG